MACRYLGLFFKKEQRYWAYIVSKFQVKHLSKSWGISLEPYFLPPKNSWPIFLVKILGFLKKTTILGLHFITMSSKTPVKILGYFIKTMFLTPKNPWPTFACQNLGTFKEYKDIGLTSYRNLRFSTFQHLGVFHKNHVYWRQKTHGLFCLSKSWDF